MNHASTLNIPKLTSETTGVTINAFNSTLKNNSNSGSNSTLNLTLQVRNKFYSQENIKLRTKFEPDLQRVAQNNGKEIPGKESKNEKIIEGVISFLNAPELLAIKTVLKIFQSSNISAKFKAALCYSIKRGLDKTQQRKFWKHFVDFETIKQSHPFMFINIFFKKNTYLREINKDIDRTLQDEAFFQKEEGKNALFRVLVVLSNSIQEVGYIQGLNSIVGTFLLYLREEDTYWMMVYLLKKRGIKKLISFEFSLVNQWNYQLKCFMYQYVPEIYRHIIATGQTIEYFSTPWFLTLYTHYFKIPVVLKIWNFYFVKGEKFFLQLAISIFKFFKKEILERDIDEVGEFLKQSLKEMSEKDDSLLELALQTKVTKKLLSQLEGVFESEKSDPASLLLVADENGRLLFKEKTKKRALREEQSLEKKHDANIKLKDDTTTPQNHLETLAEDATVEQEIPADNFIHSNPRVVPMIKKINILNSLVDALTIDRTPKSEFHATKDHFDRCYPLSARNYEEFEAHRTALADRTSNNYIETKILDDENADQILNIENLQNNLENLLKQKAAPRDQQDEPNVKETNENKQPVETPSTISSQDIQPNAQKKLVLRLAELSSELESKKSYKPSTDINGESVSKSNRGNEAETTDRLPEEEERRIEEDWESIGSFKKSNIEFNVNKISRKNTKNMHSRMKSYSGLSVLSLDLKQNRFSNASNNNSPASVLTTQSVGKHQRYDDDSSYSYRSLKSAQYPIRQSESYSKAKVALNYK